MPAPRALLLLAALFATANAPAFEGDEHRRIGDRALHIAFAMHGIDCADPAADTACELTRDGKEGEATSYGGIVERIDFMLDPAVMLVQISQHASYPRSFRDMNPNIFGPWARERLHYLRASHANDTHFQGQLLFEQHDWHKRAISVARTEDNLFAALVMNAVSDHYLHDFFAPGHIVTPRYNLYDTFSLGLHDKYNAKGAPFRLARLELLAPALAHVQSTPGHYGLQPDALAWLVAQPEDIVLHGDGSLHDHARQEALMTLVSVVSINEVIDCHRDRTRCDATAFDHYDWETMLVDLNRLEVESAKAGIVFGDYELPDRIPHYAPILGVSVGQETLQVGDGQERLAVAVESVLFGIPGSPDFARVKDTGRPLVKTNWAPVVGYAFVNAHEYSAHGPTLRMAWFYPQYESQLSLYARNLAYANDVARERRWSYGARYDIGFSALTAYFAVGHDYGYEPDNTLDPALAISFGIAASWPLSRLVPRD